MVNETRDTSTSPRLVAAPHTLAAIEIVRLLQVRTYIGLTRVQARQRRRQYGPNRLPEAPLRSGRRVFFGQFKSILILVLIGNVKDAIIILAVVVINTVVGFYQAYRAEQSLAALKDMLPTKTRCGARGKRMPLLPRIWCQGISCCWRRATACQRMEDCLSPPGSKSINRPRGMGLILVGYTSSAKRLL